MAKKRILLIDDLAIFREPIAMALEAAGYKVISAESGFDALKEVQSSVTPFDLILVDYSMPGMDGLTFLTRARGYPSTQLTAAIMLTEAADKEVVVKAMELGVKDYVLKSAFSLTALLEKVEKHLASHTG